MKLKKVLVSVLLALATIILVQSQIKAADYSETPSTGEEEENIAIYEYFDYFLTASDKILTKTEVTEATNEEIIAYIKGSYTGTISSINEDGSLIKISNFTAEQLMTEKETTVLWIEGENEVDLWYCGKIEDENEEWTDYADIELYNGSNGKIKGGTLGFIEISGVPYGYECLGAMSAFEGTISMGSYINNMSDTRCGIRRVCYELGNTHVQLPEIWTTVEALLSIDIPEIEITLPDNSVVPSFIFDTLKSCENRSITFVSSNNYERWTFNSETITNTNASFTTGHEISYEATWDMVNTGSDDVVYINFAHSGAVPGPIIVDVYNDNFKEGDILKCYYYNETTKMYEQAKDAKMISGWQLQLNIDHCSKYLVTKTELAQNLVDVKDDEEDKANGGTGVPGDEFVGSEEKPTDDKKEEVKEETKQEDKTTATGKIPHAGGTTVILVAMIAIVVIGVIAYTKNRKLKGI